MWVWILVHLSMHDNNRETYRNGLHEAYHHVPIMSRWSQWTIGNLMVCLTSNPENGDKGVGTSSFWKPHAQTSSPTHDLNNYHMWYSNIHRSRHPNLQWVLILEPNTATKPSKPLWSYTTYGWQLGRHVKCQYRTFHSHQPWIQLRCSKECQVRRASPPN